MRTPRCLIRLDRLRRDGDELSMIPVLDMTWPGWSQLHPDGEFVGFNTGHQVPGLDSPYEHYPYGDYESLQSDRTLFPQENPDGRRPMKERVLGIPPKDPTAVDSDSTSEIAFPFLELADGEGPVNVVHTEIEGEQVVVFWDEWSEAARAYHAQVGSEVLSFEADGERIVDQETGSEWRIDGRAEAGDWEGERLEPVTRAYVAFWFAWTDFHPDTELWERNGA